MSNGIIVRQNEEKSIAKLAAQRQLYRDAKRINIVFLALSVWIPFLLSVIFLFVPENIKNTYILHILSIVSMAVSFAFDGYMDEKKELAAFIQQKFDVYVYQMPWDKRIFGKDKNIDHDVAVYSKKILDNQEEKCKLNDWYSSGVDNKTLLDGILACQRENFGWDVGLRKRFKFASEVFIILLFVIILAMGLLKSEKIIELIGRLAFILPILIWLLGTVKKLNKDIKRLKELDDDINDTKIKTMEDLQDIQKVIFQHRKDCYAVPEFIYNLFKDNDEDRAYRETHM